MRHGAETWGNTDGRPGSPRTLPQMQCGVAEEMVDAQELGESSGLCVGTLACQDGISQSLVLLVHDLIEYSFVEAMGRAIEAQSRRRERGDDALSFCLQ